MTGGGMLRLMAEDAGDLDIIAAAVQDALVRMGDVKFDRKARRLTATFDRFRWETAVQTGPYERVRAALSIEGVLGVRSRKIRRDAEEALASILSVAFTPAAEPPGGEIRLVMAGGGEIAVEVECLDVLLVDLGPVWRTPRKPEHGGR